MKRLLVISILAASVLAGCQPGVDRSRIARLGAAPLCEASAARVAKCRGASAKGMCVLVADNENKDRLYQFALEKPAALAEKQQPLKLDAAEVGDIEAIEVVEDDVLILGSHSRKAWNDKKKKCSHDADRDRFAVVAWTSAGSYTKRAGSSLDDERWQQLLGPACAVELFHGSPQLAIEVCGVLAQAEKSAARAERKGENPEGCAKTFNAEGLVAVAPGGQPGSSSVWVGLRSPLLDKHAVLLRMVADRNVFAFDAVAKIDLAGWGIRELAASNGWLYGIAGPIADDDEAPSILWRAPLASLQPGATIDSGVVEFVRKDLPPSSEGLAIDGRRAYVIVDGVEGKKAGDCKVPARQLSVRLPR